MKTKPELEISDPSKIQAYYRAHEARRSAILKSIAKLQNRNLDLDVDDEGEEIENDNEILSLEGDLHLHDAKRTAFDLGNSGINPPTDEQLKTLRRNLKAVDRLTTQSRILEQIVALAKEGIQAFRSIQPSKQ